ncbi:MAG: oligoendopeptidase F [Candidatus Zixiibacteriota bacterium]|nr:MAG: oligoendopeptidase F [candidate division Zixibacteria bacterium]
MASAKNKVNEIPQRKDIEDRYKWRLSDIYESDEAWEADFKKAQDMVGEVKNFAGKLFSSPSLLFECLELRTNLSMLVSRLYQYAKLNSDIDTRVSKYQAMTEQTAMFAAQANAAFSFIEPELLGMSDEDLLKMSNRFEKTDIYDFYFRELIRSRQHIRSQEVEELLSLSLTMAKGPDTIYSLLDDADLKYPSIKDEAGNEVKLTKQRFAKFMESSDSRVRRDVSDAYHSAYKDHINTLGATLSTEVHKNVFYARARRYENSLHSALDGDNIPTAVYHSLLDTTEANLDGLHKWTTLRKKILKLDEIAPYDMLCPLFPERDFEVPYDEAVSETIEALAPLGHEYQNTLTNAFSSRWVDVYETEGKTSGAFNWGSYTVHPYVLMNYNDTVDNMFTLAHEMGHALHSHLASSNQPFAKAHYSLFVAEVASTLNEGLLLQYLLKRAKDVTEKLYLLNRHIDNTLGTYFHQVMYARFELMIHEHVEKGQALSPDMLTRLWAELTGKYYGPALTMDELSAYKWARIPHFYSDFYVYQYSTSYAASQAIMEKFIAGEEGIVDRFLELLKSGGKDYPIALLKACGIDMTTPAPFESTLKLFAQQVDEVEKLAG